MLDKMLDEDPTQACRPVEDLAKVIDGFTEQDPHPCREEERDERIKGNDRLDTKLTSNLKKILVFLPYIKKYYVNNQSVKLILSCHISRLL